MVKKLGILIPSTPPRRKLIPIFLPKEGYKKKGGMSKKWLLSLLSHDFLMP
jgi:hypothetical protein